MEDFRPTLDQLEETDSSEPVVPEHKEMTFLDHLEELRWHVIRSVSSIFVFAIAAFFAKKFVVGTLILGPAKPTFWTYRKLCELSVKLNIPDLCVEKLNFTIQSREMASQFTMHIMISLMIGLCCAFPYAFWEIWRFIRPGLYPKERKAASGATFFVSTLFGMGVLFGYFIVSPLMIKFLADYQLDESITNQFDLSSYISTLATITLACGVMFQLPMVAYVLSKAGIINPTLMRDYRKHSVIGILVLAAIITPSPDVFSQLLVALPLFILYEVSILVSANIWRTKRKQEAAEAEAENLRN